MPDAPITPDERAAMRERYAADLPSAWDTSAAAHARALRDLGTSARNDVPRLLDALDTAEAEVARLRAEVARPAPAWDEEVVVEAVSTALHGDGCPEDPDEGESCACSDYLREARIAVAVVREHMPVKPGRETVARALAEHRLMGGRCRCGLDPRLDYYRYEQHVTDAVLDLLPGRSEAEVAAEALREARDAVRASSFWADGSDNYADRVRGYLSARADRLAAEGGDGR